MRKGLRHFIRAVACLFVVLATMSANAQPAGTETSSLWVDTSDRSAVLRFYEKEFATKPAAMEWDGSHEVCDAGSSSAMLRTQTLARVNFYRAMAGVPALITEDAEMSAKAQHGALTMSAQGELSHDPDDSFACLTETAKEAAANSNLYLGRSGAHAIDGYIEDPGEGNKDVGHRNTILHPPTLRMGVGHSAATDTNYESNILWVFDENVFDPWLATRERQGFVAWPARGFVPEDIVYPRWSFSKADADFSNASVSMNSEGSAVSLEVVAEISQKGQVPASVIVWQPILPEDISGDVTYEVTVSDVLVDGKLETFRYETTIIG